MTRWMTSGRSPRCARTAAAAPCAPSLRYAFAARLATVLIETPSSPAMSLCVLSRPMRSRIRHSRWVSGRARRVAERLRIQTRLGTAARVRLGLTGSRQAPLLSTVRGGNERQWMFRLVETNCAAAGELDPGDRTPLCFFHFRTPDVLFSECRHLGVQVVTHEIKFMRDTVFGGMHGHFCRRQREN